jgi:hypothetical protein
MTKCNRCNLPIDRESEAFVTMPNAEQCGFRARRPTAFAHARCFERDVKAECAREQVRAAREADTEQLMPIEEARVMAAQHARQYADEATKWRKRAEVAEAALRLAQ